MFGRRAFQMELAYSASGMTARSSEPSASGWTTRMSPPPLGWTLEPRRAPPLAWGSRRETPPPAPSFRVPRKASMSSGVVFISETKATESAMLDSSLRA